jgi:hypothetical protein
MYEDPPHQEHITSILPGTTPPEPVLTPMDTPRQDALWCERHEIRMRQREADRQRFQNFQPARGGGRYGASVVRSTVYTLVAVHGLTCGTPNSAPIGIIQHLLLVVLFRDDVYTL